MARRRTLRCPNCRSLLHYAQNVYLCQRCTFEVSGLLDTTYSKLKRLKNSARLSHLGLHGGIYTGFSTIDVRAIEDAATKFATAQAMIDNIASNSGLDVNDV